MPLKMPKTTLRAIRDAEVLQASQIQYKTVMIVHEMIVRLYAPTRSAITAFSISPTFDHCEILHPPLVAKRPQTDEALSIILIKKV